MLPLVAKDDLNSSLCIVECDFSDDSNKDKQYMPQSVKGLASSSDPEVSFSKEDPYELDELEFSG